MMALNQQTEIRHQLDKKLQPLRPASAFVPPQRGWIRAIRRSLGLSSRQLAVRLQVSPQRIVSMEEAEVREGLTLRTLHRVARALDCTLVYAFVPNESLEAMVEKRALEIARRRLSNVSHTMALEDQSIPAHASDRQLKRLAADISENELRHLWDEPAPS